MLCGHLYIIKSYLKLSLGHLWFGLNVENVILFLLLCESHVTIQ